MKTLFLMILPLLLILSVQEVSAQVEAKTFAVGMNLLYEGRRWQDNERFWTNFHVRPDVQFFYKENRAVVAGGTFGNNRSQHVSRFSDGTEFVWLHITERRGAYVGMRQLHPINAKLFIFSEFGLMYSRQRNATEHVTGPPNAASHGTYSYTGYGDLGLMYFINKKFSLETTLINAKIHYTRPLDAPDSKAREWKFEMYGSNQVSFALRYYFRGGSKEK